MDSTIFSFNIKRKNNSKNINFISYSIRWINYCYISQNIFILKNLFGSIAGLLAGIGFGLVYVLSKTFKKYDKISLTFWQNFIALPFVLPLLFIDIPKFTPTDIGIIIILGTICTTVPFILVYRGFEKISAQKGSIAILLDIIFPILLALLIFKEIPSINSIVGGCLIIIGFFLVTTENK